MSERISREEVAHVARLALLDLTDDELDSFTVQLGAVLELAADLEALDVDEIAPTAHPLPLKNVLRPDVVTGVLDRAEVLAEAPAVETDRFRVPAALGEES